MPDVLPMNDAVARRRFEPGDILAFSGSDWRSQVIGLATWGPSHVGIISQWPTDDDEGGLAYRNLLIESTSMCPHPCLSQGKPFDGVQVQDPWNRINDYAGRAKVYRLADFWRLRENETDLLGELLDHWLGKPYDYRGALWSGTRILKYLPGMPYSDLGTMFCSEMIAASLQRLGRLCVSNAGIFNPASLVKALVRSGVYLPGEAV